MGSQERDGAWWEKWVVRIVYSTLVLYPRFSYEPRLLHPPHVCNVCFVQIVDPSPTS